MADRGFRGIWIPSAVWLSRELTLLEKCFFAEIDSLDNGDRGCVASNEYLGNFFGLSKEYVSRQVSKLEKRKLIECTYDKDTNRTIRVTKTGRLFLAGLPESEYERKPEEGPDLGEEQGLSDRTRGVVQTDKGGCPNGQGGVVQTDKHITKEDNKADNKAESEAQAPVPHKNTRFVKPSLGDVEAYLEVIGLPKSEAEAFMDRHEAGGWKIGINPMKDWKAACRTWKRNYHRFGGASAGSAARPNPAASVNAAAVIREVEAALNSREYFQQVGYSAAEGRQIVKAKNLPVWSDPAIGAAVDALGGFFKLRERVTQGTLPESVWKPQLERYYRQEAGGK